MKKWIFIGLTLVFISTCQAATGIASKAGAGGHRPTVHFAGLVFTGSYQHINANFPHTLALNNSGALDQALYTAVKQHDSPFYQLKFGLADIDKGESLVMAVAMDREFVSREVYRFDNELFTRVIADVSIQILMIDFESLVIKAAYPLSFAFNDVLPGDADIDTAFKQALFKRLYLGDGQSDEGFLPNIVELALSIQPDAVSRSRVGLKSVVIADEAGEVLPQNRNREQLAHFIGSTFTAKMAEQFDIQVIPYSRDYAVSGQMATRFNNGKVYNLTLPTPNLVLEVELQKFKKLVLKQLVYSAIMQVRLTSAIQQHVFFDDIFRGWVSKYDGETIEDWPAYEDAIELLLADLAQQMVKPSRSWFADHAKAGLSTYKKSNNSREYFKNER